MEKLVRITTVPQSLWKLLEGQLKFMTDTFEVHGISSPGDKLDVVKDREGVETHGVNLTRKLTPFRDLVSIWQMYWLLRKIKPTIVHTHTPKAGMIGMFAARLARVPIRLHTVAGMPVETKKGWIRALLLWVERRTYACAHRVYPNSNGMADFIREHNLCKASKTKIIAQGSSNGINLEHFKSTDSIKAQSEKIRADLGLKPDDILLCFIGRLVRDKGIEELIWSFEQLAANQANVHLVLMGKIEKHLDPLSESANEVLENHPRVHYLGYQDDVRPFLVAANVFVFPSYREGLPNVLLQAGAMSTPTVATEINGSMDIIESGTNGLLVPAQDREALKEAIHKMILDQPFRDRLAQSSRKIIEERYDQKKIWVALHHEYQQLVKELKETRTR